MWTSSCFPTIDILTVGEGEPSVPYSNSCEQQKKENLDSTGLTSMVSQVISKKPVLEILNYCAVRFSMSVQGGNQYLQSIW